MVIDKRYAPPERPISDELRSDEGAMKRRTQKERRAAEILGRAVV